MKRQKKSEGVRCITGLSRSQSRLRRRRRWWSKERGLFLCFAGAGIRGGMCFAGMLFLRYLVIYSHAHHHHHHHHQNYHPPPLPLPNSPHPIPSQHIPTPIPPPTHPSYPKPSFISPRFDSPGIHPLPSVVLRPVVVRSWGRGPRPGRVRGLVRGIAWDGMGWDGCRASADEYLGR